MKLLNLALPAALLAGATTMGSMQVIASETDDLCTAIAAEITFPGSNICVSMKDGVATLSGYVESQAERQDAERVALGTAGVTKVINLITTSN